MKNNMGKKITKVAEILALNNIITAAVILIASNVSWMALLAGIIGVGIASIWLVTSVSDDD